MSTMYEWLSQAQAELGMELEVDYTELLDLTRVIAHNVARPAAPLTAFLVGYAAAQAGSGPDAVSAASQRLSALAERWAEEHESGQPGDKS